MRVGAGVAIAGRSEAVICVDRRRSGPPFAATGALILHRTPRRATRTSRGRPLLRAGSPRATAASRGQYCSCRTATPSPTVALCHTPLDWLPRGHGGTERRARLVSRPSCSARFGSVRPAAPRAQSSWEHAIGGSVSAPPILASQSSPQSSLRLDLGSCSTSGLTAQAGYVLQRKGK